MIVVFVSRDGEEFNRYLRGCDEVIRGDISYQLEGESTSSSVVSDENVSATATMLSAVFEQDQESLQKADSQRKALPSVVDGEEKNIHVEYVFPLDSLLEYRKNNVFVVVMRSGVGINRLKARCTRERYCKGNTKDFLRLVAKVVHDALPKQKYNLAEHDVHLLVHWGGLDELETEEREFNKAIKDGHFETIVGCKNLIVREISTRRPCFNVQGHRIAVPVKKEKMEALLARFDRALAFSVIKDVLTKSAVKGFSGLTDDESALVVAFLSSDSIRNDLRSSMNNPQVKWLKSWNVFQEYLEAELDKVKDKSMAIFQSDEEKMKALVAQLLTIPQLLSEGLLA